MYDTGRLSAATLSQPRTTAFLHRPITQQQGSGSQPITSHQLSRARSAPNVSLSDSTQASAVWPPAELKDDASGLSPMEYIEKLILIDFLEPLPQN